MLKNLNSQESEFLKRFRTELLTGGMLNFEMLDSGKEIHGVYQLMHKII